MTLISTQAYAAVFLRKSTGSDESSFAERIQAALAANAGLEEVCVLANTIESIPESLEAKR